MSGIDLAGGPRVAADEPGMDADTPPQRRRSVRRRMPGRYVVFALLAIVAVGVLGWLMSWYSPVPVREVTVVGAEPEKEAQVLAAAAIQPGTPIRELDTAGIEQRVAALPGIQGVELQIQRPWTIVVDVLERFPFAVVATGERWTVIDASGAPISESPSRPPGLPQVDTPDHVAAALPALNALSPELRHKIRRATVAKDGGVVLTTKSEITVEWGAPGDDAAKAQAVSVLLQYHPTTINVSVPTRPALTGELRLPKQNQPDPSVTP